MQVGMCKSLAYTYKYRGMIFKRYCLQTAHIKIDDFVKLGLDRTTFIMYTSLPDDKKKVMFIHATRIHINKSLNVDSSTIAHKHININHNL